MHRTPCCAGVDVERTTRFEPATLTLARYADLCKPPETIPDLQFWLTTGSRGFAVFHDAQRPVHGLRHDDVNYWFASPTAQEPVHRFPPHRPSEVM